jgi:lanosterol synthase
MARTRSTKAANGETVASEKKPNGRVATGVSTAEEFENAKTDMGRWRMLDERGRQTWHYLEDDEEAKKWPQSTADKWYLGLQTVRSQFLYSQLR